MYSGLSLEQLRAIAAVARTGSFTAAAKELGRVQSAVSQAIDRLETELGLRLFDRSSRVPALTEHGRAIARAARRVCAEVERFGALSQSLEHGNETSLCVVVDALFPHAAIVAFAHELERQHPGVEFYLITETLSAVTARVRDKQAAFGIAGPAADATGLERRHVTHVRMVPVAAATHRLARVKRPLSAARLEREVQIVLSELRAQSEPSTSDQAVLTPRTWRVADLSTKHALILGGLGFGNMPEHWVREELRSGRLIELDIAAWSKDEHRLSLALVRRPGSVLGPVARWAAARISALCRSELSE